MNKNTRSYLISTTSPARAYKEKQESLKAPSSAGPTESPVSFVCPVALS
jgi:hypothetical protein